MNRRQRVVTILAVVLAGILLGVGGWLLVGYIEHRRDTDHHLAELARENRRNGDILIDCTTPTPPPSPENPNPRPHECFERGQRGQSGAIVEVDCRARRMQARLPAPPDPRSPCTTQTPAEVYPGLTGQPPRG
jgi:hypothetical protein